MKLKYIILTALIGFALFRLFNGNGNITLFNILLNIGGALVLWGIFVWGYDNPEERSSK